MTGWKVLIIVFGLIATILFANSACGAAATPAPTPVPTPTPTLSPFPLKLTDANGKEVVIEEPPTRIVSFDSDSVEILFAMGEGHRIIATHDFVDYPPETADIERVGGAFALNLEKIVELEPDLVYIFFDRFVADLENLGLKVLYKKSLNSKLQDVAEHFRLWGRITGNPQAAEDEIEKFQSRLAAIEAKLSEVERGPSVYHRSRTLPTFPAWYISRSQVYGKMFGYSISASSSMASRSLGPATLREPLCDTATLLSLTAGICRRAWLSMIC